MHKSSVGHNQQCRLNAFSVLLYARLENRRKKAHRWHSAFLWRLGLTEVTVYPAMLCRWIERCIITIWLCLKLETRRWWRRWFRRSICVLVTVHNTMKAHHINISKHKHHIFAQEGGKPWIPQSCLVTPVANPKVSIWRGRVGRGTQKHTRARAHKLAAWAASFERLHIHRVSPVSCLTWRAPSQTFGHYIIALK